MDFLSYLYVLIGYFFILLPLPWPVYFILNDTTYHTVFAQHPKKVDFWLTCNTSTCHWPNNLVWEAQQTLAILWNVLHVSVWMSVSEPHFRMLHACWLHNITHPCILHWNLSFDWGPTLMDSLNFHNHLWQQQWNISMKNNYIWILLFHINFMRLTLVFDILASMWLSQLPWTSSILNIYTVDMLILHTIGAAKTWCISTYMHDHICHTCVIYVTSAKIAIQKSAVFTMSTCIILWSSNL
jgi:hypothetical protein